MAEFLLNQCGNALSGVLSVEKRQVDNQLENFFCNRFTMSRNVIISATGQQTATVSILVLKRLC